ncbi:HDOD domain-containing protein [Desulfocurvus sp. DL9XJH121]
MSRRRILFIDDEPLILRGLRRSLRPKAEEWDMIFTDNGVAALEAMRQAPVDIIVSDIVMPEMNGLELMNKVKDLYPDTIRIAMTGHSSADVASLSALTVHRFLNKPCKAEELIETLEDSIIGRNSMQCDSIRKVVSRIDRLCSVPTIVARLNEELSRQEVDINAVAAIVAKDVSMSAKILQLVNSPFFGFARHIDSPNQAVTLLGLNVVRSLVLCLHLFAGFNKDKTPDFNLAFLFDHSVRVSVLAKRIARAIGCTKEEADHAFISGLLHDIGKIIIATHLPDSFNESIAMVKREKTLLWQAERKVCGCSHDDIGGYLMRLWGLPSEEVLAITHHHIPSAAGMNSSPLMAVHVANIFDHRLVVFSKRDTAPLIDGDYTRRYLVSPSIEELWTLTLESADRKDNNA